MYDSFLGIRIYSTQGRFTLAKNREFKGHVVSGYACQIAFSPNGRFLASGDEGGLLSQSFFVLHPL